MRVSVDNDADRDYRIVSKTTGEVVNYVTSADTESGTYTRFATGEDGQVRLSHRVVKEMIEPNGIIHYYDPDGNEVGEPDWVTETVAEPFRIIHGVTRETVAETTE